VTVLEPDVNFMVVLALVESPHTTVPVPVVVHCTNLQPVIATAEIAVAALAATVLGPVGVVVPMPEGVLLIVRTRENTLDTK
jgi:hypothetical protein